MKSYQDVELEPIGGKENENIMTIIPGRFNALKYIRREDETIEIRHESRGFGSHAQMKTFVIDLKTLENSNQDLQWIQNYLKHRLKPSSRITSTSFRYNKLLLANEMLELLKHNLNEQEYQRSIIELYNKAAHMDTYPRKGDPHYNLNGELGSFITMLRERFDKDYVKEKKEYEIKKLTNSRI